MRNKAVIAINFLVTIVLIETTSAFLLKERMRKLYPHYLDTSATFSPFPRQYFEKDEEIGFDIQKNSQATPTNNTPPEAGSYLIFSNTHGCFDKREDYSSESLIYIAGDSFTWGYAPYEKKFATLLEEKIHTPVAKCGVTGTGQIHQFEKFSRLHKMGRVRPQRVIVNIFANDIEDDFLHPINTVIEGWLVRNTYLTKDGSTYKRAKYSQEENIVRYKNWRANLNFNPKRYSATAILMYESLKRLRPKSTEVIAKEEVRDHYNSFSFKNYGKQVSMSNFNAILKWKKHAIDNGYKVSFLAIPPRDSALGYYSEFIKHAKASQIDIHDFQSYIQDKAIEQSSLYYDEDGHFNPKGNLVYLEFIQGIIKDQTLE